MINKEKKMRRKELRSLAIVAVAYLYLAQCASVFAAATGNYTDLLPIGAAGNTTVISNGSGWSLTTLAPSQTFGDALSRAPMTVYQSTGVATINATTTVSTMTAISGQGKVGSTTFPASWIATGRTIETTVEGSYSTAVAGSNWTWGVLLGTTSVLSTGALTPPTLQTGSSFKAVSNVTVLATGASGTVMGSYQVWASSGASNSAAFLLSFSTGSSSASVDLTSQLTVNPVFNWGTANSSMTIRNVTVKFIN